MNTYSFKLQPYTHQREDFEFLKDKLSYGIFEDMGLGKSKIALDFLRFKCIVNNRCLRTLIVAPSATLYKWLKEIEKNTNLVDRAIVVTGTPKQREEIFSFKSKSIFIITPQSLSLRQPKSKATNKAKVKLKRRLNIGRFDCIIIDECQCIKNNSANITKLALELAVSTKYKLALSGTPFENAGLDTFTVIKFLDNGKRLGENFYDFRRSWCINTASEFEPYPKYEINPLLKDRLREIIKSISIVRTKEECLDFLPPKIYMVEEVIIDDEMKKVYKQLKKDFIAEFEGSSIVSLSAPAKFIKLRQLMSGYAFDENNNIITFKNNKLDRLKELLEELCPKHKVIVWAYFRHDVRMLKEELKQYNPAVLYGETKDAQTEIDNFELRPEVRVMIANPGSGGAGIDLIEASYAIYYSQGFSATHRNQSENRCHRIGSQKHKCITYIDLVYKKTIDEIIKEAIDKKIDLTNDLLGISRKLRKEVD